MKEQIFVFGAKADSFLGKPQAILSVMSCKRCEQARDAGDLIERQSRFLAEYAE